MQTIAITGQKGGTAKTTTAHTLGVALATDHGRRTLLIDLDPQGSLTLACGVTDTEGRSIAEVIGGAMPGPLAMGDVIQELGPGLWLAPSDLALASSELGLVARMGRENVLKRALASIGGDFDVCLIDCPPSLGLLTINALVAADGLLIPTLAETVGLRALRVFLGTLQEVRRALNGSLETVGVVVTFYDRRLRLHRQSLEAIEAAGLPVLATVGRSVRVAEASAVGETVLTFARSNPQAVAFRELAQEVDRWLKSKSA